MGWITIWLLRRKRKRLVTELAHLGFYRYITDETSAEVQADFVRQAILPVSDLCHGTERIYPALFKEPPYPGWLKEMVELILPAIRVQLPAGWTDAHEQRSDNSVGFRAGDRTWRIEHAPDDEEEWDLAERQLLLQVLNGLLEEASTEERAWHVWGEKGESLYIIMTPAQQSVVTASGAVFDPISSTLLP